jgi:isoleucyl-tRNA synthetase
MTHGYVLDQRGYKMSKSLGNVISPQEVWSREGSDILRLWAVTSDYSEDVAFGPDILKQNGETYRRLRNTLRYLLGALDGFDESERVEPKDMAPLERWVLHRLYTLDRERRAAIEDYDFTTMINRLHHFAAVDLSAFYFDIRKDSLYCDAPDDLRRKAVRTVMKHIFDCLVSWLAPVLCFTAEEAWQAAGNKGSIHLQQFPSLSDTWRDDTLAADWERLRAIRAVVTGAVELERAEKRIGASLQANVQLIVEAPDDMAWLSGYDFPLDTLAIVSHVSMIESDPAKGFMLPDVKGFGAIVTPATGEKCERCWRVLDEVGKNPAHAALCNRCVDAVTLYDQAAE